MVLTKRDLELFKKLQSYALLTTSQIGSMVFDNINHATVLRRLRKLEAASYIRRIHRLESYEIAWSVTIKASSLVGHLPIKRIFRSDVLEHDLKLTDLRLKLEGAGIAQSWIAEHEIRSMVARKHGLKNSKERIVSDGVMSVFYKGGVDNVAIELELNFKNYTRYRKILAKYKERNSLLAVWYLVHSKGLGLHLQKIWNGIASINNRTKFAWSLADDVLENPASAKLYQGKDELLVNQVWLRQKQKEEKNSAYLHALPPALPLSRVSNEKSVNEVAQLLTTTQKNSHQQVKGNTASTTGHSPSTMESGQCLRR